MRNIKLITLYWGVAKWLRPPALTRRCVGSNPNLPSQTLMPPCFIIKEAFILFKEIIMDNKKLNKFQVLFTQD